MQCRALETGLSDRTAIYYRVFCSLAKLIQVKSATLQKFQLAFKHLLLLEKNSRLHPIFQNFALTFHTFSRSGKVVRKFPDFFKNSRLCTNPVVLKFGTALHVKFAYFAMEAPLNWLLYQASVHLCPK